MNHMESSTPETVETAPTETHFLEHPPACGNGLVWSRDDGRIAVAADSLVVVMCPRGTNEAGEAFGLVAWKQGVPCLGDSPESFTGYRNSLYTYPDSIQEDEKKGIARSKAQDVGRGRSYDFVKNMLELLSVKDRENGSLKIQTSFRVAELLDDVYFNPDAPKVVSIAWSPSMCSDVGGCLLGVVFDDSSVMLYSVSEAMSASWNPLIDLSRYRNLSGGLSSSCLDIAWSEEIVGATRCFSIIGVVSSDGTVDIFRVTHMSLSLSENKLEERIQYIGKVDIPGERICHMNLAVMEETHELLVLCGCQNGSVFAWSDSFSHLENLDTSVKNMMTEGNNLCIFEKDYLMVSCIDCSMTSDPSDGSRKLLISVGKTVGVVQIYMGGDIDTSKTILESLERGIILQIPRKIDSHTVSGIASLMNGRMVVATSRLGNIITFRIAPDGLLSIGSNPIHHNRGPGKASYKGFGYYGIAASPGGNFIAVAKQAQEPDQAYNRQKQVYQMITQGYIHIQSVVGPDAEVPSITDSLKSCIDGWTLNARETNVSRASLWDIERLATLSERMEPNVERLPEILQHVQDNAGLGLTADKRPCVVRNVSLRHVAVLIHLLRALQKTYDQILSISDLEMVMMKATVERIMATDVVGGETQNLSPLLALDFAVSHQSSHGWIFTDDFVEQVKDLYAVFGEDVIVDGAPPSRQISPSIKDLMAPMSSGSVDESLVAFVSNSNNPSAEPCPVPRCPASLLGILDGGAWACQSCHRSFGCPARPECLLHGGFACTLCAGVVEIDKYFYS